MHTCKSIKTIKFNYIIHTFTKKIIQFLYMRDQSFLLPTRKFNFYVIRGRFMTRKKGSEKTNILIQILQFLFLRFNKDLFFDLIKTFTFSIIAGKY